MHGVSLGCGTGKFKEDVAYYLYIDIIPNAIFHCETASILQCCNIRCLLLGLYIDTPRARIDVY
jgi:hypothetical protein